MDQGFIKKAKKGAKMISGVVGGGLAAGLVTSAIADWGTIVNAVGDASTSIGVSGNAFAKFSTWLDHSGTFEDYFIRKGTAIRRGVLDTADSMGMNVYSFPEKVSNFFSDIFSTVRGFFGGLNVIIGKGVKYVIDAFRTVFTNIGETTWAQGSVVAIICAFLAACAYWIYKIIKRRRKIKENFIRQYKRSMLNELKMPKMPKMPSIKGKNKDFLMKAAKGAKIAASVTAGGIAAGLVTSAIVDWDLIEKASFFSMKNNTSALNEFAKELASTESFGTKVQRAASKIGLAESPDTFISKVTNFFRTWFGGVVTQLVNAVKYVFNAFKTVFTNIKSTTLGQGVTVAVVCAFLAACVYWIYRIIKRKRKIKENYIRFI